MSDTERIEPRPAPKPKRLTAAQSLAIDAVFAALKALGPQLYTWELSPLRHAHYVRLVKRVNDLVDHLDLLQRTYGSRRSSGQATNENQEVRGDTACVDPEERNRQVAALEQLMAGAGAWATGEALANLSANRTIGLFQVFEELVAGVRPAQLFRSLETGLTLAAYCEPTADRRAELMAAAIAARVCSGNPISRDDVTQWVEAWGDPAEQPPAAGGGEPPPAPPAPPALGS